jgi:hypothetical protein
LHLENITVDSSSNDTETELPVQKQLEAYNARDIDAFMQWWADDCQYYEFPSRLLANGAVEIRERHVARFKNPTCTARSSSGSRSPIWSSTRRQ